MPTVLAQSNLPKSAAVVVSSETIILRDPNNSILEKYTSDEQRQKSLNSYGVKPVTMLSPGDNKTSPTPSGVKFYDWLQTDGRAYINTGILPEASYNIEAKFLYVSGTTAYVLGVYENDANIPNTTKRVNMFVTNVRSSVLDCGAICSESATGSIRKFDIPNSLINASIKNGIFKVNEEAGVQIPSYDPNLTWSSPLYLFALNNLGNLLIPGILKIFDVKITDANDITIAHFKPAKYDGEIGFYDTVSQQMFLNANEQGAFEVGNGLSNSPLGLGSSYVPNSTDSISEEQPQEEFI